MISIIMPVYNAEKTLKYSVGSVLGQRVNDIELILVDDGSTDGSLAECRRFEQMDNRVHVYTQSNLGVSAARNLGLGKAKGDYIAFCDADDYVHKNIYYTLLLAMETGDVQLAVCGYEICSDYREELKQPDEKLDSQIGVSLNREETFCHALTDRDCLGYLWNKLFLRSYIVSGKEVKICFDEKISILEDHTFVMQYISKINKAYLLKDKLYYYVQSEHSVTHQSDMGRDCSTILARRLIYQIIVESHCSVETVHLSWQYLFKTNAICYKNLLFAKGFPERKQYLGYINDCITQYGRKQGKLSCFTWREKFYYFLMKLTRGFV